jgi:predicted MFS family arabinose efflux permease
MPVPAPVKTDPPSGKSAGTIAAGAAGATAVAVHQGWHWGFIAAGVIATVVVVIGYFVLKQMHKDAEAAAATPAPEVEHHDDAASVAAIAQAAPTRARKRPAKKRKASPKRKAAKAKPAAKRRAKR